MPRYVLPGRGLGVRTTTETKAPKADRKGNCTCVLALFLLPYRNGPDAGKSNEVPTSIPVTMLRPKSKFYYLSAAGELRPCAAYSDPSVRESPVFPNRKLRECAAFACSCEDGRPGNPVPSHSLSDTIFIYTDIGRTRSDRFSSAASRLITLPFFTNFFIAGGRAIRQAVVEIWVWVRLLEYVPLFSRYSNYLFDRCSITRSGCGAKRLFPAFINYFFFSGGRSRQAVARVTSCARWTESPELRPPFLWLYEQFFHNNIRLDGPNPGAFTGTFRTFGLFLCLPL